MSKTNTVPSQAKHKVTSVPATLNSFTQTWHPHLIATINDHHVKVAKIVGEFIWHAHPNSDEMFYILAGEVEMEIETTIALEVQTDIQEKSEKDGQEADEGKKVESVTLKEGDVFTVPRGVRHRPIAKEGATIMMVEREGTVNTGDEGGERTVEVVDRTGAGA